MKKLLKMLLALATTTTVPLTVVACGQESLDGTLSTIYKAGTDYSIALIPGKTISTGTVDKIPLTTGANSETEALAKNIVHTILSAAGTPDPQWYQNDLAQNEKCYNFNITNGTQQASSIEWDVNQSTQRFNLKISYLVGTVASDKSFKASQKIDMSFNIKVGTSKDDGTLKDWITTFNTKPWNVEASAIQVDLTTLKIDLPNNVSWNDLDKKVIAASNDAINNAIQSDPNWVGSKNVTWNVKASQGTVDPTTHLLLLTLEANLGDSYTGDGLAPAINSIYIKFI